MATIEIDFDVYKALTLMRSSEEVTYNDVLRDILGLGTNKESLTKQQTTISKEDWIAKGVRFPKGTEFRATYKGLLYTGRVESGAMVINGKKFYTPSAAAGQITKNNVNGWEFWECKLPGKTTWQTLNAYRKSIIKPLTLDDL